MLSTATLFVVSCSVTALPYEAGKINISKEFITSLRRQLKRDNYDYSEEDEQKKDVSPQMRANSQHDQQSGAATRHHASVLAWGKDDGKVKDLKLENIQSKPMEHVVSNRDLLYYMDDQELVPEQRSQFHGMQQEGDKRIWSSATRYEVLKLKHQYRRRNQPRLIQEESKGAVAIVNLDGGPVPEVRLPRSRRQYMRARGDSAGDEEELPPPAVDSSEPEAAPEDAYSKSNVTQAAKITN